MSKLRIGMIGAGAICKRHLNAYQKNAQAEVTVICDLNEALVKRRAEAFGIAKYCTDPMEVIQDPEIDAVNILTPTFTHKDLVIAALRNGKHVLCEKPPALNAAEAAEIEAEAKASGKLMQYGFVVRFSREAEFLKDYIASGAMGCIYCDFGFIGVYFVTLRV